MDEALSETVVVILELDACDAPASKANQAQQLAKINVNVAPRNRVQNEAVGEDLQSHGCLAQIGSEFRIARRCCLCCGGRCHGDLDRCQRGALGRLAILLLCSDRGRLLFFDRRVLDRVDDDADRPRQSAHRRVKLRVHYEDCKGCIKPQEK